VAAPGSKDYGSLSIAVQVAATPRRLFDVGHDAFRPVPRVESTVLEIDLKRPACPVAEAVQKTFFEVVRWTFGHRRKMLRGTLRTLPGHPLDPSQMDEVALRSGFDLRRRPETLTIGDFERLAEIIQQVG
jgi:16S rRNA (adenine1518-N6/adenine1519-N6)-dimethyltransferase